MDFGEPREYTARASLAMPPEMREKVERIMAEQSRTLSAVLRGLIAAGLEVYDREKEGE